MVVGGSIQRHTHERNGVPITGRRWRGWLPDVETPPEKPKAAARDPGVDARAVLSKEQIKTYQAAFDTIDVDRSGQVGHPSRPLSRLPLTTSLFTTGRNRSDTACGRSTRASCARRSSRWDRSYQRRTSRR